MCNSSVVRERYVIEVSNFVEARIMAVAYALLWWIFNISPKKRFAFCWRVGCCAGLQHLYWFSVRLFHKLTRKAPKSPIMIVDFSLFLFSSLGFCSVYFQALVSAHTRSDSLTHFTWANDAVQWHILCIECVLSYMQQLICIIHHIF